MLHVRRYRVDPVDLETLIHKLLNYTWCGCQGFRLPSGWVLLNDATSPDGAQEYAVLDPRGNQVESLTVSWMSGQAIRDRLTEIVNGIDLVDMGRPEVRALETPGEHGTCPLCR